MQKTAYPTSSTRRTRNDRARGRVLRPDAGFTFVEAMVAMALGSIIFGGVITTYVMIGRVLTNTGSYCDLDYDARRGLEEFGREARSSCLVNSGFTATSVTLGVPDTSSGSALTVAYSVTYQLGSDPEFPGQNALLRVGPPLTNINGASATTVLIHNVTSLTFNYYSAYASGYYNGDLTSTANQVAIGGAPIGIKQIELTLTAQRSNRTVATATNTVISARFTLRNK